MFSKKDEAGKVGKIETIIGQGTEIKGTVSTKGSIRVDGTIEGGIINAESAVIGEDGKVKGDINAQTVIVGGQVTGNITASTNIEILPHGQVNGDINAPQLFIAEGAVFEGKCIMNKRKESHLRGSHPEGKPE